MFTSRLAILINNNSSHPNVYYNIETRKEVQDTWGTANTCRDTVPPNHQQ